MVKYMLGSKQAGYYSIAVSMADMVYLLPAVIGIILFPKLSAMASNPEKWIFTKKISLRLGVVMLVVVSVAILLAEPTVRILFGKDFLPSVMPFSILMPAIFFYSMNAILDHFLAAIGFPLWTLIVWAIGLLINVVLNIYWIKSNGIVGAAFASLVAYAFIYACHFILIRRNIVRGF
jgi:O-antigen/teichoic acid export membrane protein